MNEFETRLGSAFPGATPSAALDQRIAAMAADRCTKPGFLKLSLAGVAAGLGIVATVFFVPRLATASTLSSIADATARIRHYRMTQTEFRDDGRRTVGSTTTFFEGQSREVRPDQVRFSRPGSEIVYYPAESRAVVYRRQASLKGLTDLKTMVDMLKASNWVSHVSVDRVSYEGRDTLRLSLEEKHEPVLTYVYADAATDLPFRAEIYWRTPDGRARLQREVVIDYASPVTLADVDPRLPKTVHVVDDMALRDEWRQRLSKGLATIAKDGGRVVVRSVSVTPDGYVYVLYTGGDVHVPFRPGRTIATVSERPVFRLSNASDSQGREYLAIEAFQGTMYTTEDKLVSGYVFDGEDVQVAAFAPVSDARPEWPITLKLSFDGSNQSNATYEVKLAHANSSTLAEYFPYLGMAPSNENELFGSVSYARGAHYLSLGDNASAERWFRESVRQSDLYAASIGENVLNGQTLYYLGLALERQGKTDEARSAFERALRETNPANEFPMKEIQKELSGLKVP